jgi:antitoxin PrlF
MEEMEITTISSRGQVVIPFNIRKNLGLRDGERFAVVGEDDTIVLKKITMPSFNGFDKLLNKTQEFAKNRNISPRDLRESIKRKR